MNIKSFVEILQYVSQGDVEFSIFGKKVDLDMQGCPPQVLKQVDALIPKKLQSKTAFVQAFWFNPVDTKIEVWIAVAYEETMDNRKPVPLKVATLPVKGFLNAKLFAKLDLWDPPRVKALTKRTELPDPNKVAKDIDGFLANPKNAWALKSPEPYRAAMDGLGYRKYDGSKWWDQCMDALDKLYSK